MKIPSTLNELEKQFIKHDIPTSKIAFYNHDNFLRAESKNQSFLELYGAFVRMRKRDADYDKYVRRVVPIVAQQLARETLSDGQKGACVDVALMFTKILEELGVWSYSIQGALKITNPELPTPTHFWMFDEDPIPGHVWVVAPPYEIIDITLQAQPYQRQEANLVPRILLSEGGKRITPKSTDFFEPSLLDRHHQMIGGKIASIHEQTHPSIMSAVKFFPSWLIKEGKTQLRYATAGISLSDAPNLNALKSRTWNGRYASAILEDLVRPALKPSSQEGS
ncbi:hypothetical protein [Pseudovibrio sp. JE062]|uniref:hypothetical protein n=1 Tax=Pseudovibrio sp. JE062 TaxID=439495 RepID=UPI000186B956|nr:hypothetical protein [Pseudovibrio sp. JE062]EEA94901.1 hypothetical protein PJE062_890 [Pseudovibrio sp. JE062]